MLFSRITTCNCVSAVNKQAQINEQLSITAVLQFPLIAVFCTRAFYKRPLSEDKDIKLYLKHSISYLSHCALYFYFPPSIHPPPSSLFHPSFTVKQNCSVSCWLARLLAMLGLLMKDSDTVDLTDSMELLWWKQSVTSKSSMVTMSWMVWRVASIVFFT